MASTTDARALVLAARDQWVKRLIDPSRANALLFFRDLKVGMLELPAQGQVVAELVAGGAVGLSDLRKDLPQSQPEALARSVQAVRTKALSNREEKGVETLQLALGMASWPALDGGRPYAAPVLLLPLAIESRGQGGLDVSMRGAGEARLNPVLLHVLAEEHGLVLDADELLEACSVEDEEGRWSIDPAQVHARFATAVVGGLSEFAIQPRALVANFHFARMSMVEDLAKNGELLARSELVAALAGHAATRARLGRLDASWAPTLDARPAEEEFHVLVADSSQQAAIELAEAGQHIVVQGPPGTGKSQTIANLIAQSVASGKRVLFVAEKRAALEAVIKRLSHPDVGLGHLVLDLHGATVSRKEVMARLKDALDRARESLPPAGAEAVLREFEERRRELNAHAQRVNAPRQPTGKSLVQMVGELHALPPEARTHLRLDGATLAKMEGDTLRLLRESLRDMVRQPELHLGSSASPWTNARLVDGGEATRALELARRAERVCLPVVRKTLKRVVEECGVAEPASLAGARELAETLLEAERQDAWWRREIHAADPAELARRIAPAARGWFARLWAACTNGEYRATLFALRALRVDGAREAARLLAEAQAAASLGRRWSALGGDPARARSASAAELAQCVRELSEECARLRAFVPDLPGDEANLGDLERALSSLAKDGDTVFQVPTVREHQAHLRAAGLQPLVDELRAEGVAARHFEARFDHVLLASSIESVFAAEPKLASFRGAAHQQLIERFRELDVQRVRLAAARVRRRHAAALVEAMNEHGEEADLVRREASKKARHMPLRRLLEEAPHVLTRLAPCWVASPLSVSQLLSAGNDHFDLVLFDEGSQIPPEDAVPALYRARQVVAAGDQHQMPPTQFFATAVDAEDIEAADDVEAQAQQSIAGFESLLATLESFLPNRLLEWHYRSEDERLIAFSNAEVYSSRLYTFPGARGHEAIRHELVPHDPALGGQEESASREVARVVELVLEHARTRPGESLGVITMGIKHANRVQAALDKARTQAGFDANLGAFFDLGREERFFVKNLETVQGDERDAIILSIGYGKDASGGVPLRFGPLLHESGYRRLNVAVTRAKRRMLVVSSFASHEIDLGRSSARGLAMLKAYLAYAETGGTRLSGLERADQHPLNAFEADIRDALEKQGLKLRAQYGAARFRIDLVAMHPDRPGQPVLAIECDGASYHSSATARDRDRLRQQHLERLGWTFHRIWSTDWFRDREAETRRALDSFRDAVARADAEAAGPAISTAGHRGTPPPTPPPADPPSSAPTAIADAPARRLPRPRLPHGDSIDDYTDTQLQTLFAWIASDDRLRTDEELVRLACDELGFARLGSRIKGRLEGALTRWRRTLGS